LSRVCAFLRDPLYRGGGERYGLAMLSGLGDEYEVVLVTEYGVYGGGLRGLPLPGKLYELLSWAEPADCDVIVSFTYDAMVPALLAALARRAPAIVVVHDLVTAREHGVEAYARLTPAEKAVNLLRERVVAPALARLHGRVVAVAVNPLLARLASRILGSKAVLIPPGVEPCRPPFPGYRERSVDLAYVGRLVPHKRLHVIVAAVALLRERGFPVNTVIAGSGPELDRLKALAARLGVDDLIAFPGRISEEDKDRLLRSSRLFANPSSMEGFGIAMVEAMCRGAVPVARDRDYPEKWIAGASAAYCRGPCGPGEVAEAVERVLGDPRVWSEKHEAALSRAREFTINRSRERFRALLDSLARP